jgi:hypothetical protein
VLPALSAFALVIFFYMAGGTVAAMNDFIDTDNLGRASSDIRKRHRCMEVWVGHVCSRVLFL